MAGLAGIEVSFMWLARLGPQPRSYGNRPRQVQRRALVAIGLALVLAMADAAVATERPVRIVALGDSLMAGYQLPASAAFPAQLERALRARKFAVDVVNAGVSGDTAAGGLARLDWSVPEGTDAVILGLGANDVLRGIDPKVTRAAIEAIVKRLKARGIEILLCGMLAPPNLGEDYTRAFNAIYPELAAEHGLLFYPFFLGGIFADPKLNQNDGLHPTADGIAAIVGRIMPKVEELVARVRDKPAS